MDKQEIRKIGPWAEEHADSFRTSRPREWKALERSARLRTYLEEIQESAEDRWGTVYSRLSRERRTPDQDFETAEAINRANMMEAESEVMREIVLVMDEETEAAMQNGYLD